MCHLHAFDTADAAPGGNPDPPPPLLDKLLAKAQLQQLGLLKRLLEHQPLRYGNLRGVDAIDSIIFTTGQLTLYP